MDDKTRNRLQNATQDARRLLANEFAEQLEGTYDILPDGRILPEVGKHLDNRQRLIRRKLVDAIEHLKAGGRKPAEAIADYTREAAFTFLNRFVALKMLEARGLVQQCISKSDQSSGFKEFTGLAPGLVEVPDHGYRLYLECLFDELSVEVKVLFDRCDVASLLWPRRQALTDLLDILNQPDLAGVWDQDETIGWVYQYFNSQEERRQMREESQAPRNSRELAVRNQFFTPRYVVEFLTDNTLGRIWYEMRQGETRLKEQCRYLVRRPNEVFLNPGQSVPPAPTNQVDLSQEELLKQPVYISHRPTKDPRTIRLLDPTCGSMHFGLYAFELFLVIYEEAWELEERKGPSALLREVGLQPLRDCYKSRDAFLRDVPRLIVEHNLHGIDIDARCAQIAAFALWMRAQEAYNDLGLPRTQRPSIRRTNIVVAEPMPGENDLLKEFTATLQPKLLGHLVEVTFDKMQLAGEAGSLLKIEDELSATIAQAKKQWLSQPKPEQLRLFAGDQQSRPDQLKFDLSGITDEQFWNEAETLVLHALRRYAEHAVNGMTFRRKLFADDAARGFAFIDLCRKRYDVVLMNPPFGAGAVKSAELVEGQYPECRNDLYGAFILRAYSLLNHQGSLGAITNRTGFFTAGYEAWRSKLIYSPLSSIRVFADLGSGVLDSALVETAAYCCDRGARDSADAMALIGFDDKGTAMLRVIQQAAAGTKENNFNIVEFRSLNSIPAKPLAYWAPPELVRLFNCGVTLEPAILEARQGLRTLDDFRFLRLWWETPQTSAFHKFWVYHLKGGPFQRFYGPPHLVCNWKDGGAEIKALVQARYGSVTRIIQAQDYYFRFGLTYTRRTSSRLSVRIAPAGCNFADRGPLIVSPSDSANDLYFLLGFLNSPLVAYLISLSLAAAEGAARSYEVGIIQRLPLLSCTDGDRSAIAERARQVVRAIQFADRNSVNSSAFVWIENCDATLSQAAQGNEANEAGVLGSIKEAVDEVDARVLRGAAVEGFSSMLSEYRDFGGGFDSDAEDAEDEGASNGYLTRTVFSETVRSKFDVFLGTVFGRWDIQFATGEKPAPELPDPFAPLPVCPPGQLQSEQGLPITKEEVGRLKEESRWNYPIEIPWDGILVDDPGHPLDIEARVCQVLEIIWKERAEEVEHEASEILGVHTLRDYFRKPAGFFADHLSRYSKSRRRAPIYWQLTTTSGSYSIWLYYHRFTPDTFYKVLNDYVKPKFDHEQRNLDRIRADAGREPNRSQRQEIDGQETFVAELRTFQEEIERIAPLWNPDLNDGVMINFAPLWRLVPQHRTWQKECEECWDKLVAGEYDWSHLAMHLWPERVVPRCQTDASLAIAHGLEEEFWWQNEKGKWVPKQVPKGGWKLVIDNLVTERTKPAVKAAMESLLNAPTASRNGRGRGTIARKRKA